MKAHKAAATVLAIVAMASAGRAATIIIDPDAFVGGTVLNNAFAGVTLTAEGDDLLNGNVLALEWSLASTSPNVFGRTSPTGYPDDPFEWGDDYNNWLRADFAVGATSVSIDFIADDATDSGAVLRAFDTAGSVLDTAASTGTYGTGQVVTLTVNAANIAYVQVEPDLGGGSAWRLDHLTYDPVPEPVTMLTLLVGGAVIAAGGLRRRIR